MIIWHEGQSVVSSIFVNIQVPFIHCLRRRWDEDLHSGRAPNHMVHAGSESVVKKFMSYLETFNGFGNEEEVILNDMLEVDTMIPLRVKVEKSMRWS